MPSLLSRSSAQQSMTSNLPRRASSSAWRSCSRCLPVHADAPLSTYSVTTSNPRQGATYFLALAANFETAPSVASTANSPLWLPAIAGAVRPFLVFNSVTKLGSFVPAAGETITSPVLLYAR